jgi:heme a synthase
VAALDPLRTHPEGAPHGALARRWFVFLGLTVVVAVFGTVVRVTGSGAGCGQHWPTCHGEIAHLPASVETAIELTHRVTSGLLGIFCLVFVFQTWRATRAGHLGRRAAALTLFFLVVEGLLGRALVVLSLVGDNASSMRAFVMGLHLINTSLLLTANLVTAWSMTRVGSMARANGPHFTMAAKRALLGALILLVISAAGAVTALGDTLYPVAEEATRGAVFLETVDPNAHFLERLRGFHPVLAVLGTSFLLYVAADAADARLRLLLVTLLVVQVGLGVLNVALGAPGYMQVVHLTAATLLWVAWSQLAIDGLFGAPCTEERVASMSAE